MAVVVLWYFHIKLQFRCIRYLITLFPLFISINAWLWLPFPYLWNLALTVKVDLLILLTNNRLFLSWEGSWPNPWWFRTCRCRWSYQHVLLSFPVVTWRLKQTSLFRIGHIIARCDLCFYFFLITCINTWLLRLLVFLFIIFIILFIVRL